jgi:hypothetical protein
MEKFSVLHTGTYTSAVDLLVLQAPAVPQRIQICEVIVSAASSVSARIELFHATSQGTGSATLVPRSFDPAVASTYNGVAKGTFSVDSTKSGAALQSHYMDLADNWYWSGCIPVNSSGFFAVRLGANISSTAITIEVVFTVLP